MGLAPEIKYLVSCILYIVSCILYSIYTIESLNHSVSTDFQAAIPQSL